MGDLVPFPRPQPGLEPEPLPLAVPAFQITAIVGLTWYFAPIAAGFLGAAALIGVSRALSRPF